MRECRECSSMQQKKRKQKKTKNTFANSKRNQFSLNNFSESYSAVAVYLHRSNILRIHLLHVHHIYFFEWIKDAHTKFDTFQLFGNLNAKPLPSIVCVCCRHIISHQQPAWSQFTHKRKNSRFSHRLIFQESINVYYPILLVLNGNGNIYVYTLRTLNSIVLWSKRFHLDKKSAIASALQRFSIFIYFFVSVAIGCGYRNNVCFPPSSILGLHESFSLNFDKFTNNFYYFNNLFIYQCIAYWCGLWTVETKAMLFHALIGKVSNLYMFLCFMKIFSQIHSSA